MVPEDLRYSEDHEWVRLEGDTATLGVSDFAQEQLTDIVFVELPEVGRALAQGDEAAVIESVKAASELYAPVDGEVADINMKLGDEPGLINSEPTDGGWFIKMKIADASQIDGLMDEAAYQEFVGSLE